ncbi:DUF4911 domain-containing protein [uncultured Pseudodesulfovibrio sp.]|uniref:DUF4911 domain-containing protein n=1 Tax=uncultured Pseudodesulfovibrio sp. TaxID=2035858 RepID=UPI0029C84635|nr:DUF4911 domain-containing protein [uncultured Pseudodesulfovibrio sp.]
MASKKNKKNSSRRRPRQRICPPPPKTSERTYVRIEPTNIGLFRFLLEAHDNLGIFTVTDKFKGILMLRYSPHQKQDIKKFIRQVATEMDIEVVM